MGFLSSVISLGEDGNVKAMAWSGSGAWPIEGGVGREGGRPYISAEQGRF